MGDRVTGIGHQLLQAGDGAIDRLDTVVDVEDLTFPEQFTPDCGRYGLLIERAHVCEDGMAILGWGPNVRHIANSSESQLESPGNGGGGESENIHSYLQSFHGVFGVYPESLLLIDDQQP